MILSRKHALLFDLDGTLADTAPDLGAALNHVLARAGLPPSTPEQYRSFVGQGAAALMTRALATHGAKAKEAYIAEFLDYYAAHIADKTRLFPHTKTALDWAKAQGFALGVVTNKRSNLTRPLLEALGLTSYFSSIVCGDTTPKMKPDPAPIRHALRALHIPPARAIMIGDSDNDIQAAHAIGVASICVCFGYHPHFTDKTQPAPHADRILSSYAELPAMVTQWLEST